MMIIKRPMNRREPGGISSRGQWRDYERTWNVIQNLQDGKCEGGIQPAVIVTRIINETRPRSRRGFQN